MDLSRSLLRHSSCSDRARNIPAAAVLAGGDGGGGDDGGALLLSACCHVAQEQGRGHSQGGWGSALNQPGMLLLRGLHDAGHD